MENMSEDRGKNMAKKPLNHICIGLLAHVDAGKTTLSESMLYLSGRIRQQGRVDHGNAYLDTYELERANGELRFFQSRQSLYPENFRLRFWIHRDMWISRRKWSGHFGCLIMQSL